MVAIETGPVISSPSPGPPQIESGITNHSNDRDDRRITRRRELISDHDVGDVWILYIDASYEASEALGSLARQRPGMYVLNTNPWHVQPRADLERGNARGHPS